MGAGDFIYDPKPFTAIFSESEYVPDYAINPHPRFGALTRNIRMRRGKKVDIKVPLYRDVYTPEFNMADAQSYSMPAGYRVETDPHIAMDCMAFGMGMCCLVSNSSSIYYRT
jgi:glutamate--cysteine ligase catalytic subunit